MKTKQKTKTVKLTERQLVVINTILEYAIEEDLHLVCDFKDKEEMETFLAEMPL